MTQTPTQIPDLTLPDQDGTPVNPALALGKFVVIYFYPKALTPGCTQQACAVRDSSDKLKKLNVVIYGVSPDAPKLLKKFKETEGLDFTLLSDADHRLAERFGSWVEKSMYGRTYMGMSRDSFVFGPDGKLIASQRKISPKDHMNFIIDAVTHSHI